MNLDAFLRTPGQLTEGRTYVKVLQDAYVRIQDPDRWTQGAFARERHQQPVRPTDPTACRWCLLGGTAVSSNRHGIIPPPLLDHLDSEMRRIYGTQFDSVHALNDYLGHAHVLLFLRRVIEGI